MIISSNNGIVIKDSLEAALPNYIRSSMADDDGADPTCCNYFDGYNLECNFPVGRQWQHPPFVARQDSGRPALKETQDYPLLRRPPRQRRRDAVHNKSLGSLGKRVVVTGGTAAEQGPRKWTWSSLAVLLGKLVTRPAAVGRRRCCWSCSELERQQQQQKFVPLLWHVSASRVRGGVFWLGSTLCTVDTRTTCPWPCFCTSPGKRGNNIVNVDTEI